MGHSRPSRKASFPWFRLWLACVVVGVAGWASGLLFAGGLVTLFTKVAVKPDGSPLFAIAVDARLAASAALLSLAIGAVAALFPARRAARLEPAVAIRHV